MTRRRRPVDSPSASSWRRGGGAGEPAAQPVPPPSDAAIGQLANWPLLIDSREVARLLGIGRTKAFTMMARDELPVIRIGRCVRVSREALVLWIANHTTI